MVEGCSRIQLQALALRRQSRASTAPPGPFVSGHRSNPSFERTCQSWLGQLRPAAQLQR